MTLPVTLSLVSPTTQAAAPFCVGHAFKKGDVPSGSGIAVSGATAQVTPKNYWPDGSLKFAVIAGTAALAANTPATVTLSVGTASTGTALTIADLKATGITASINLTNQKDYSFDTAAQTIGAQLVMLSDGGNSIAGTFVSCTVTADNGAAVVSISHTLNPDGVSYTITADISGGVAGNLQTVTFTLNYVNLLGASRSVSATVSAPVRTGGGISWNGTSNVYKTSNVLSVTNPSWSGTDWDTPFDPVTGNSSAGAAAWVSGHRMSSWIYRRVITPHLTAWLEVRLYAGGAVEVLPWIENGNLQVACPTSVSATYGFTLGGTSRVSVAIDLKHHQRTPLINGPELSYWIGTAYSVAPKHDKAYLQASELVPSYRASVSPSATQVAALASTYTPLQAGNFIYDYDAMPSPGYQSPIGMLPEHDVLYLTCNTDITYAAVVRNGFSAGRYGIHYRDETTNRPLRFSSYPNLVIRDSQGFSYNGQSTTGQTTPVATGGHPPSWDVSHSPSVGFLAYLVTGRWYFMEEVQFATTCNYLGNGNSSALRTGSLGLVKPEPGAWQTRSCAWDWRARVQALCVTPDADTVLRNEFIASVEANIDYFYSHYITTANNPYGFIKPGGSYDGIGARLEAPWMQDFVTAAFGYSLCLGLPISGTVATKLSEFFQWKAKSIVMRLGTSSGFWYINADPYTMPISPSTTPDYDNGTGPWYATDAEVYAATYNTPNATYPTPPAWLGSTEGVLAGEYDISVWVRSMWGNLQPAIAYAVRHNVPGAAAGYARMTGASNWSTLASNFDAYPVWSVMPLSVPTPPAGINLTGASSAQTATSSTGTTTVSQMTPGPSVRIGADPDGSVYIGARGMGILGSNIASSGTNGAAPLYASLDPGDGNNEYRMLITSVPAGLHLEVSEFDGSVKVWADTDETFVVPFDVVQNGASVGSSSMLSEFGTTTLTGANSTQSNTSGVGAVGVNPFGSVNLVGDDSSQSATSSTGAIGIQGVVNLVGSSSTQTATSGTGAIVVRDSSPSNFAVTVPADVFLVTVPTDESGERGVLVEFIQQTDDVLNYAVSFNTWLATRAVPDTAKAVEVTSEEGITIGSYSLASGVVTLRGVNGSTDGCRYKATLRLTTNGGRVKEVEILIKVKNSYLAVFEKQPTELMDYDISFVDWFSSRSLSNVPDEEPEVLPDGGIVVENSHMANGVQKTWLSGGTDLDAYDISTLVHAGGMLKKATIRIKVRDT